MTRVLVSYATRFGSTREIASAIAHELNTSGFTAQAAETGSGLIPEEYDAFVIGSPLYGGKWLSNAAVFAFAMAEQMKGKPVALFSVGTLVLNSPERGRTEHSEFIGGLVEVTQMGQALNVVADVVFSGYFDRSNLPWWLRIIDRFAPTPQGDHRDWPAIQAWAKSLVPKFETG